MNNQPISKVMTPQPASVAPSNSIASAERVMREYRCHHVPVVDDGRVVGIVSARDLLKALLLEPDSDGVLKQSSLESARVSDIMRPSVTSLSQTGTVLDAAKLLRGGDIHALPVVGPGDVLVGIVTSSDLIDSLADDIEVADARRPADADGAGDERTGLLRQVYRATVRYLESGQGEIEHGRLLQAVNEARERIAREDLPI